MHHLDNDFPVLHGLPEHLNSMFAHPLLPLPVHQSVRCTRVLIIMGGSAEGFGDVMQLSAPTRKLRPNVVILLLFNMQST